MGQRIRGSLAGCLAVLDLAAACGGHPTPTPAETSVSAAGYSQQAELAPSDASGDDFGASVALSASGTTALVGNDLHNLSTGAAYVFTLRGGSWSQTAELTPSGGAQADDFGFSVALSASGTTALVGAPGRYSSSTGAAYLFTLRDGTWSQSAELTASDGARDDEFGDSVALSASGTTALAGAPGRYSATGAAYLFRLRGGTWSQTAELAASDGAREDEFGASVALSASGTTALAGAPGRQSSTGAAYLFTLRSGTWSQTAELTASNGVPGDGFGYPVALSAQGTTALAGESQSNGQTGAAYLFTLRSGTWSQTAELTASDGALTDAFGISVALSASGTTALAGATGRNSVTGVVYVFTLRGGTWSQTTELTASNRAGGAFGRSVALSSLGTTALIGAPLQSAAYVFAEGGRA